MVASKQLSADQLGITTELQSLLRERILSDGPMSFLDYMNACLYEPGLGYYVNGLSKLGADGDFVTAPELSNHFANCIARQAADVLQGEVFKNTEGRDILEFGAGSGQLAFDVLMALDQLQCLPDRYLILDVSGQLAAMQQQLLTQTLEPRLRKRVHWIRAIPDTFSGVVVANELFDAFPVERFTIEQSRARRIYVDFREEKAGNNEGFFTTTQEDLAVQSTVNKLEAGLQCSFPEGFTSEYCGLLAPWWKSMADAMQQGLVLVCDYGCERASYYPPSRSDGTLRCFFRHGVHNDPLVYAGVQDLTADVDFTALTEAAIEAGFELEGYSPLAQFMLGTDVLQDHGAAIANVTEHEQLSATGKLKQLLLPQEMGERFMVAGYSVGLQEPLRGFSLADWSRLL